MTTGAPARWSTGHGEPRVIYCGGVAVGVAFSLADAALIVRVMNDRVRAAEQAVSPQR